MLSATSKVAKYLLTILKLLNKLLQTHTRIKLIIRLQVELQCYIHRTVKAKLETSRFQLIYFVSISGK